PEPRPTQPRGAHTHRPTVPLHDAFDDGEAETVAGLLAARRIELNERIEDAAAICFRNTGTVVIDAQSIRAVRLYGERNDDTFAGVLDRVVAQIAQHGLHQMRVAPHMRRSRRN